VAAEAFLEELVEARRQNHGALKDWLEKRMAYFMLQAGHDSSTGSIARIARNYALVYAVGCLANKFGVLPWNKRDTFTAVKNCHKRLIPPQEFAAPQTPQRSIGAVGLYIERNRDRFIDLRKGCISMTKEELQEAHGIIYPTRAGEIEYLFATDRFNNTVCGGLSPKVVVGHLVSAGLVRQQAGGKTTVTRDFPKPLDRDRVVSIHAKILHTN
jgi:hypothetical protein